MLNDLKIRTKWKLRIESQWVILSYVSQSKACDEGVVFLMNMYNSVVCVVSYVQSAAIEKITLQPVVDAKEQDL